MGIFMAPFNTMPGVLSGFHPMFGAGLPFTAGYHGFPYPPPTTHRVTSPNVVTEDDFQTMIQVHRKRRLLNEVLLLVISSFPLLFCPLLSLVVCLGGFRRLPHRWN